MKRTGFAGGRIASVPRGHFDVRQGYLVVGFRLTARASADRFKQTLLVAPIDLSEGLAFDCLKTPPQPKPVDRLGLEQAEHAPGKRIVVTVTNAADGRICADQR